MAFQAADDAHYARFVAGQRKNHAQNLAIDWLETEPSLPRQFSLLDIGCGPGAFFSLIHDRPALAERVTYTGVDQAEGAVRYAEKTFGRHFLHRDVLADGLPDGSFDVISVNEVIEHLADYRPLLGAIAQRNPKVLILGTFAVIPEYDRDRKLWRPDLQCYMNSYALAPLFRFLHETFGGEIRSVDFGTTDHDRYWFPKKTQMLWYRRAKPVQATAGE
jgi:SAM-dependent methyltransferase